MAKKNQKIKDLIAAKARLTSGEESPVVELSTSNVLTLLEIISYALSDPKVYELFWIPTITNRSGKLDVTYRAVETQELKDIARELNRGVLRSKAEWYANIGREFEDDMEVNLLE